MNLNFLCRYVAACAILCDYGTASGSSGLQFAVQKIDYSSERSEIKSQGPALLKTPINTQQTIKESSSVGSFDEILDKYDKDTSSVFTPDNARFINPIVEIETLSLNTNNTNNKKYNESYRIPNSITANEGFNTEQPKQIIIPPTQINNPFKTVTKEYLGLIQIPTSNKLIPDSNMMSSNSNTPIQIAVPLAMDANQTNNISGDISAISKKTILEKTSFKSKTMVGNPMLSNSSTNNSSNSNILLPIKNSSEVISESSSALQRKTIVNSSGLEPKTQKNKKLETYPETDIYKTATKHAPTTNTCTASDVVTGDSGFLDADDLPPPEVRWIKGQKYVKKMRMGKERWVQDLPDEILEENLKEKPSREKMMGQNSTLKKNATAKYCSINKLSTPTLGTNNGSNTKSAISNNPSANICCKVVKTYLKIFTKDGRSTGQRKRSVRFVAPKNGEKLKKLFTSTKSNIKTSFITSSEQESELKNNIISKNSSTLQLKSKDQNADQKRNNIINAINIVNIDGFDKCKQNKKIILSKGSSREQNSTNDEVINSEKYKLNGNESTSFMTNFGGASNYFLPMVVKPSPEFRNIITLDFNSIRFESLSAINNRMMILINLRAECMFGHRNNVKYVNTYLMDSQYRINFCDYSRSNTVDNSLLTCVPERKALPVADIVRQDISNNQILALETNNQQNASPQKNEQRSNNSIQLSEEDMQRPRKKPEDLSPSKGYKPDPEKERIARKAAKLIKNSLVSNYQNTTDLAKAVKKILSSRCKISIDSGGSVKLQDGSISDTARSIPPTDKNDETLLINTKYKTNISVLTKINLITELIRDKKTKKCMQDFIVNKTPKFKMLPKFKMSKVIKKAPNEEHKERCITKELEKNTNEP